MPKPPIRVSIPEPPIIVSAPEPPLRLLASLLPVRMLLPLLPVPLIVVVPARVRFSTLAGKVVVIEEVRVSVIVVVAIVFVPSTALIGLLRVSLKFSFASLRESLRIGILMDWVMTPGLKVKVPVVLV